MWYVSVVYSLTSGIRSFPPRDLSRGNRGTRWRLNFWTLSGVRGMTSRRLRGTASLLLTTTESPLYSRETR